MSYFEGVAEAEDVALGGHAGHDVIKVEEVEGGMLAEGPGGAEVVSGLFPVPGGEQLAAQVGLEAGLGQGVGDLAAGAEGPFAAAVRAAVRVDGELAQGEGEIASSQQQGYGGTAGDIPAVQGVDDLGGIIEKKMLPCLKTCAIMAVKSAPGGRNDTIDSVRYCQ